MKRVLLIFSFILLAAAVIFFDPFWLNVSKVSVKGIITGTDYSGEEWKTTVYIEYLEKSKNIVYVYSDESQKPPEGTTETEVDIYPIKNGDILTEEEMNKLNFRYKIISFICAAAGIAAFIYWVYLRGKKG